MNWERGRSWGWGGVLKRNQGMIPTPRQRRPLQTSPALALPFWGSDIWGSVCLAHDPGTPMLPNSCFGPKKGPQRATIISWSFFFLSSASWGYFGGSFSASLHWPQRYLLMSHSSWCTESGDGSMGLPDGDGMSCLVTNVFFFSKRRNFVESSSGFYGRKSGTV